MPTDQQLRDYGFELAKDYGIVGDGVTDNVNAFATWIDACKNNIKTGYLHYSAQPYMTSNRIVAIHRAPYHVGQRPPFETFGMIGGKNPATGTGMPEIKLTAGALGYGNVNDLKPLFFSNAVNGTIIPAPFYEAPDNPFYLPPFWTFQTGNQYSAYIQNIHFNTNGHVGAIGVSVPGAQRCFMADIKVTATGSAIGICGWPATNQPSMNIHVIGGAIGIAFSYLPPGQPSGERIVGAAGELLVGLKIEQATVPIQMSHISGSPAVIVGFEIDCAGTVYTTDSTQTTGQALNLVDGRINITGGGNPIAFVNTNEKLINLHNVYITGTSNLLKSGTLPTLTGTGTWKCIKDYTYSDPRTSSGSSVTTSYSVINGVLSSLVREPYTTIQSDVPDPGTNIRTRHIAYVHSVDDGIPYIEAVSEYGVNNTATGDARIALQTAIDAAETAGHNRVFLRKGNYDIGQNPAGDYGIKLKSNTILFGIFPRLTTFGSMSGAGPMLRVHISWAPTSGTPVILDTPNDPNGNCVLCNIGFGMPTGPLTGSRTPPVAPTSERFGCVRWRVGNGYYWPMTTVNAVDYSVDINDQPPTNPRTIIDVVDSGGGKFYGLSLNNQRLSHRDLRGFRVTGPNTRPTILYGNNTEIAKAATGIFEFETEVGMEVINASNVAGFGKKSEGRSGVIKVTNGNNIAFFGGGVLDSYILDEYGVYGNSDNILFALGLHRANYEIEEDMMLRENLDATPEVVILGDDQMSVYRRGVFDIEALFAEEPPPPTPTIVPSKTAFIKYLTLTVTWDRQINIGAGGSTGLTLSSNEGALTATYSSGTNIMVFNLNRFVRHTEVITMSYAQPGDGFENSVGHDVESFSNFPIRNIKWVDNTSSTGNTNLTEDSRKFTPVPLQTVPQANWTEDVAITPINMNDYIYGGDDTESFITYLWSDQDLPNGVTIDSGTGVISGTPTDPVSLTDAFITLDNQCTGSGAPLVTQLTVDMPFQVT